jgi:membrane protein
MARLRWVALAAAVSAAVGYGAQRVKTVGISTADAVRRGRHAETPMKMTFLGWKDVLARTWQEANDDRVMSVAGSVAFFTLLALVPGLSVLISIYGLFTDPGSVSQQLQPLTGILPYEARSLIEEQATRLAAQSTGKLSVNLVISLLVAIWSANAAIKGLFDSLNVIYGEVEKRSFLHFNVISLMTTMGAVLLLIAALFVIALAPTLLAMAPYGGLLEALLSNLRWPIFYVLAVFAIAVLYWIGPSRHAAKFIWVLPGAAIAALLWAASSALFSYYVQTLGDYTATYGSLATVIVFMTWLWLSSMIILMGAELNAELEHQTAEDSTQGPPKPLGARGAMVADNIGPATVEG